MKYLIFLILSLLVQINTFAQTRTIEIEFDEVENASMYEFEFRILGQSDVIQSLSQKTPLLEIELPYNHYEMRQRTKDQRKVPGSWSDWEKISVLVPEIQFVDTKTLIDSKQTEKEEVEIKWTPVGNIKEYEVKVFDIASGKEIFAKKVSDDELEFEVPVAAEYQVSVNPVLPDHFPTDLGQGAKLNITVVAAAIEKPKVNSVKNQFSQLIAWEKEEKSDGYDVLLERYNLKDKKWELVYKSDYYRSTEIAFDPRWRGGKYSLKVAAKGKLRKPSSVVESRFELAPVRTPRAEYTYEVSKAIDRVDGYFVQASWLMTQFKLSSYSFDTNTYANTKPLGGTLRAGGGYFRSNKNWGISGYVNSYHIIVDGEDKDFASFELSGVYRHKFFYRDELRIWGGVSEKEMPMLMANQFSLAGGVGGSDAYIKRTKVNGPKLALEYWYSLGTKIGVQANYSVNYYNLFKNSGMVNGVRLEVPTSYQMGLMMSYKFSNRMTGLLGLSHEEEYYKYGVTRSPATTTIPADSKNTGSLKANYIGLMVEIGL